MGWLNVHSTFRLPASFHVYCTVQEGHAVGLHVLMAELDVAVRADPMTHGQPYQLVSMGPDELEPLRDSH